MSDRLASGSARLDAILDGGLLLNGINLIMGRPGSGKTILAQQYLFHNATAERPALYLSTVSEPLEKILRYGQSLSFFDKSVVGTSVIYEDLGQSLNGGGLSDVLTKLVELLRERRPALMVIDSFKALRAYAPDDGSFRRFLHDLAGHLSASQTTSFWVGEYDSAEATEAPEFAVADAIVSLGIERNTDREIPRLPGPEAPRQRVRLRQARLSGLERRHRRLPAPGRSRRRRHVRFCARAHLLGSSHPRRHAR